MTTSKEYFILEPAKFKLDGGAMFGIIPKPLWDKVAPADELNRIDLALRLLLIKSEQRVVLIDTGIGDHNGEKFDQQFDVRGVSDPLTKALGSIGLLPQDITDLIMSHLHFDHAGGMGKIESKNDVSKATSFVSSFPNATLHIHKSHWDYSHAPSVRDAGSFHTQNFDPIIEEHLQKNKVNWLSGESGEIIPELGIKFLTSQGHTPWMCHPYDENVLYLADLIPTSNHIHVPWVMGYDIAPGITTEDKQRVLPFIIEKNLKVIFEHDPDFWGATLTKDERGKFKALKKFDSLNAVAYSIT